MSKSLTTKWTCLRCLRRQQQLLRRHLATAAIAHIQPGAPLRVLSERDDTTLRKIFDSQLFWQDFSEPQKAWNGKRVGLFQNRYLQTPQGFSEFAEITLQKCKRLVDRVVRLSTIEEYKQLALLLDRLSDLLCRIIDIADFVRATHPDPAFQQAASQAHHRMFEYMNILNTTTDLNDQLKVALTIPEVVSSWTEEELRVVQILKKDFSQSAIDLPKEKRQQFVQLSNQVNDLGSAFLDGMQPDQETLSFERSRLYGLDPRIVRNYSSGWNRVELPVHRSIVQQVLVSVEDESVRKQVYIASRNAAQKDINLLESMLRARAELASLSGFSSYAEMTLTDKMAGSPEAVSQFLAALIGRNKESVHTELVPLLELKQKSLGRIDDQLNPWDRDYYRKQIPELSPKRSRDADNLSAYFSLGTVMQGLSRLFTRLYGVRFQPVEPLPGETWSPDVRRLDVIDENDGRIAVVYCDLFARGGKSPNPAHFTLRCSRFITAAEIQENHSFDDAPQLVDPISLANDGMATSAHTSEGVYQLPTIALICDFPPPKSPRAPPLLPTSHLTTLFHEMGHAIHSILGRTSLQNVAGTRCATDFCELPSILMESFATNPTVLALYARHWETDAPLPDNLAQQIQQRALAADGPREGAADTEWQILLSLFDQAYHSDLAGKEDFDSTAVAHNIYQQYASLPEPHETRWQGFFGHLVGYGGSYYSYLFDRAIAKRVWEVVFNKGLDGSAIDRKRGERYKKEVLRWGGSREPWVCVASLLQDKRLTEGGPEAMKHVGAWGVSR
ncbi:MAG: hypothetical protein GOMPHAMPRED_006830 [Gomphillus americanus]|uniref:Mitochondrial intermediate peptidase n=1 Tax=Gomphillus americanus TaxID=1940652 RepID=A0A8H3EN11_9LECA|nr:MAG: hypothetical protein GOMPHAMPRED_006830 [Gomphillus americanus]